MINCFEEFTSSIMRPEALAGFTVPLRPAALFNFSDEPRARIETYRQLCELLHRSYALLDETTIENETIKGKTTSEATLKSDNVVFVLRAADYKIEELAKRKAEAKSRREWCRVEKQQPKSERRNEAASQADKRANVD